MHRAATKPRDTGTVSPAVVNLCSCRHRQMGTARYGISRLMAGLLPTPGSTPSAAASLSFYNHPRHIPLPQLDQGGERLTETRRLDAKVGQRNLGLLTAPQSPCWEPHQRCVEDEPRVLKTHTCSHRHDKFGRVCTKLLTTGISGGPDKAGETSFLCIMSVLFRGKAEG